MAGAENIAFELTEATTIADVEALSPDQLTAAIERDVAVYVAAVEASGLSTPKEMMLALVADLVLVPKLEALNDVDALQPVRESAALGVMSWMLFFRRQNSDAADIVDRLFHGSSEQELPNA